MNKIDSYFNTRAKRNCLFLILIYSLMIIISCVHLYLGLVIIKALTYEQIFSILNSSAVNLSFLGRMTVNFMSTTRFEIIPVMSQFLSSLYLYEIIFFVLSVFVIIAKANTKLEKQTKSIVLLNWCIYLILFAALAIVASLAFKAGSLFDAFSLLHFFGYGLIGINGFLLVVNGFALCTCLLIDLPEAMAYQVEEVEE